MAEFQDARVADHVARTLHACGIRHAFGMPGGEVVTLIDGLQTAGIRFVLGRHETAAAIMAAGAYRAGGAPGLLVTTLGPGLANAVNGIADAWQERVPLIVLSGVVERSIRARYTHQIVDQAALLRPLVKASFEIERTGAPDIVARAIRLATTPPFGPVHLDLAPDIAAARTADGQAHPTGRTLPMAFDPRALEPIRRRLEQARFPVIVAGMDAACPAVQVPLKVLAERTGAPLITTYRGKGILAEDHPQSLGAAGLSPLADRHLRPVLQSADVVVLLGYDPIEMRSGWLDPFAGSAEIIELGPAPFDHAMHRADLRLQGEVAVLLEALVEGMDHREAGDRTGMIEATRAGLRQAFTRQGDGFGPHAIGLALQEILDPDTTLTIDSGAHRILLSQMLRLQRPLQLLQSSGWCTMGAALPLAIGVKREAPERRVIGIMGDGGLEMVAGELATLRDLALPVTLIVLQDKSLALIAMKQAQAGLPPLGVGLPPTDLVRLAQAFGGHGVRVQHGHELSQALAEAVERPGFTLIACMIDPEDYVGRI